MSLLSTVASITVGRLGVFDTRYGTRWWPRDRATTTRCWFARTVSARSASQPPPNIKLSSLHPAPIFHRTWDAIESVSVPLDVGYHPGELGRQAETVADESVGDERLV